MTSTEAQQQIFKIRPLQVSLSLPVGEQRNPQKELSAELPLKTPQTAGALSCCLCLNSSSQSWLLQPGLGAPRRRPTPGPGKLRAICIKHHEGSFGLCPSDPFATGGPYQGPRPQTTALLGPLGHASLVLGWRDTCNGVGVNQDEREEQVMAAVLLKSLCQESSAQLNMRKSLMQTKGTGECVG